jgi:pimeloyl-ACP methyl ester carboxylesterase
MIQRNKTSVASAIIAAYILTACGGSSSKKETIVAPPVAPPSSAFIHVACDSMLSSAQVAQLSTGSSCGFLTVPEKHAVYGQPATEKNIEIAVVKLAAISASKKSDPVVYLEGGPGGSATASISRVVEAGTFVHDRDVYLVDQRGTGRSKPALLCTEYSGEAGTAEQVSACKARLEASGVDLSAYNSVHNALDIIKLREVLSIPEWNIYGISYGTRLATTILRENSTGIRSVILDGVFPVEVNGISDTPWANYEQLNQIIKNCDNTEGCSPEVFKEVIEDIIARMHNENMIEESREFVQNLLNISAEPTIIDYLLAVNEDISNYSLDFDESTEPGGSQEEGGEQVEDQFYVAMGLSTVCAEEYPFLNTTDLVGNNSQGWSATTQLTVAGMFHMDFDAATCKVWNVEAANNIETQAVSSNLPVLILNGLQDTQTPATWGALVAKNIPNSQNITNPQGGHGQLFSGSDCFELLADKFLATPSQSLDTSCVSLIPDLNYEPEEASANFTFQDNDDSSDTTYMNGVIGSDTLDVMQEFLTKYPQIKTIVMQNVPGSMDDDVNLKASLEIRNRGIATHIPADGMVASGGTDMFLAGAKRTIDEGARLGVHSWSDNSGKVALDYPRDHEEHVKYLDYYDVMGIPADFYWYTLEAAPADSIHWMTAEEIAQYNILKD